jgi:protein-L-isoaspartate(D-aspartate) O-methyltransferase
VRIRRLTLALLPLLAGSCNRSEPAPGPSQTPAPGSAPAAGAPAADRHAAEREAMVREQIEERGVRDPAVLAAMRAVPRHELVPAALRDRAYEDHPLPIGHDQTISQPFIVALMTELAAVERGERVLEVGTGSGYQAAVLAALGADVYSIEIVEPLARRAAADLERLGYRVHVRAGDGYRGWPEAAPFGAILVTAAPPRIPHPLVEQLAKGGRMVIPVGDNYQELRVLTKDESGEVRDEMVIPVRFVPMTGEAQQR